MCGIVCVIGDAVCVVLACDWPSRISRMRRGGQRVVPKLVSLADMFSADAYHCRGRLVESGWSSQAGRVGLSGGQSCCGKGADVPAMWHVCCVGHCCRFFLKMAGRWTPLGSVALGG